MKAISLLPVYLLMALISCKTDSVTTSAASTNKTPVKGAYQYLALGDSYTIGQSVSADSSFPAQLVQTLKAQQVNINQADIIARTGWTTDELQSVINTNQPIAKYDFVTLLIGVNNQFRGYSEVTYRKEFVVLLNQSIQFAKGNKQHVFVLSIPDWGATPYAKNQDKSSIATQIDQFNAINQNESQKAGVNYVDITPISREAATNLTLVAGDGLHPSAKMYALWVQKLMPLIMAKVI